MASATFDPRGLRILPVPRLGPQASRKMSDGDAGKQHFRHFSIATHRPINNARSSPFPERCKNRLSYLTSPGNGCKYFIRLVERHRPFPPSSRPSFARWFLFTGDIPPARAPRAREASFPRKPVAPAWSFFSDTGATTRATSQLQVDPENPCTGPARRARNAS